MIRCLSLWQPWASLVAIDAKRNETRSGSTPYRGPVAIHAAKMRDADSLRLCHEDPFTVALAGFRVAPLATDPPPRRPHLGYALPFGVILSVHRLVDCVRTETIRDSLSDQERAFGNYDDGRWAWIFEPIHRFDTPIPYRGAQGLFWVPLAELASGGWALAAPAPAPERFVAAFCRTCSGWVLVCADEPSYARSIEECRAKRRRIEIGTEAGIRGLVAEAGACRCRQPTLQLELLR